MQPVFLNCLRQWKCWCITAKSHQYGKGRHISKVPRYQPRLWSSSLWWLCQWFLVCKIWSTSEKWDTRNEYVFPVQSTRKYHIVQGWGIRDEIRMTYEERDKLINLAPLRKCHSLITSRTLKDGNRSDNIAVYFLNESITDMYLPIILSDWYAICRAEIRIKHVLVKWTSNHFLPGESCSAWSGLAATLDSCQVLRGTQCLARCQILWTSLDYCK